MNSETQKPAGQQSEDVKEKAKMSAGTVVSLLQWLMLEAPGLYASVVALVKKEPTNEDFDAALKQIEEDTFEKLVPNAEKFPAPGGSDPAAA